MTEHTELVAGAGGELSALEQAFLRGLAQRGQRSRAETVQSTARLSGGLPQRTLLAEISDCRCVTRATVVELSDGRSVRLSSSAEPVVEFLLDCLPERPDRTSPGGLFYAPAFSGLVGMDFSHRAFAYGGYRGCPEGGGA